MSRTTEQWEALLEGTTEGPWGWRWDEGLLAIIGPDGQTVAIDADVRDSDALAAAPEAVAEVVRLRRELEEISIGLDRKAERAQRNGAYSAAVGYRETAKKITRILNGESNV